MQVAEVLTLTVAANEGALASCVFGSHGFVPETGGLSAWGALVMAIDDDKDEDEAYFEGDDEIDDDEDEVDDFDEFDDDEDESAADEPDDDEDEEL